MPKHIHHDLIVKWAVNPEVTVEFRRAPGFIWLETQSPGWDPNYEYRIKPRLVKKEGWIALFGDIKGNCSISKYASHVYSSKEEAERQHSLDNKVVLYKIEWEEEEV